MARNRTIRACAAVTCGLALMGAATPALAGTVKYDLNGPAGVVHEHTEDGDVEVEEIGVDFAGIGKLTGWNTERDGSGTAYAVGDKVSGDATLFAQYDDGTMLATGLVKRDGKTYYYGPDGSLAHGKQVIDGKMMWFDEGDGARYENVWITDGDGDKYRAGEDGVLVTGVADVDGDTYAFEQDGKLHTGFFKDGDDTYYADPDDGGKVAAGSLIEVNGKKYYAAEDGKLAHGLTKVDGKEYVFDASDGAMVCGTWTSVNGKYAYCGANGEVTQWSDTVPGADENQGSSAGNGSSSEGNNTSPTPSGDGKDAGTDEDSPSKDGAKSDGTEDQGEEQADADGSGTKTVGDATGTDDDAGGNGYASTNGGEYPQTGYANPGIALLAGGASGLAAAVSGLVGRVLHRDSEE